MISFNGIRSVMQLPNANRKAVKEQPKFGADFQYRRNPEIEKLFWWGGDPNKAVKSEKDSFVKGVGVPSIPSSSGNYATDMISENTIKNREVMLDDQVTDQTASAVIHQLKYLDNHGDKPITLVINSPGGSVSAGLAIYDTIQGLKNPVRTYVNGMAASMGAFLAAAGANEMRFASPNSTIMIHQPLVQQGPAGQETDIRIHWEEMSRIRKRLENILAEHTGKEYEEVKEDCERDNYMTPEEAKNYGPLGLIDHVYLPQAAIDRKAERAKAKAEALAAAAEAKSETSDEADLAAALKTAEKNDKTSKKTGEAE